MEWPKIEKFSVIKGIYVNLLVFKKISKNRTSNPYFSIYS